MSVAARLDDAAGRLRALQDIDAIETLKARYWRGVDSKNPACVEACLTADAVVDFEGLPRFTSRAAFMEIVRRGAARAQAWDMHHGHNPVITLTGADSAEGSWDIFYYGIDVASSTLVQMAGTYSDRYVRRGDDWLIASTTMCQSSLHVQTVTGGVAKTLIFGRADAPRDFQPQENPA